jgi:energy-coupling factor transporter ATP-binding protein EcfA2
MIEIRDLTKRYGRTTAVDHLTVTVRPGRVTGFLGPNGAGKSTTMRAIVGLDRPTAGDVLVDGRRYADHPAPLREVGALLDARSAHPGRSAAAHLLALAATPRPASRPGRAGARPGRADRRGRSPGRRVLPRHGAAPGHRRRAARRSRGDPPGRAGQRPGPRLRPVDPAAAAGPRRRGTHGLRLLPPDERDGADRRPADHPRPRAAARGRAHAGDDRGCLRTGPGALFLQRPIHPAAGGRAHRRGGSPALRFPRPPA